MKENKKVGHEDKDRARFFSALPSRLTAQIALLQLIVRMRGVRNVSMQRPAQSKGLEREGGEDRDVSFSVKPTLRCAAIGQRHPELTSHCFGAGKKPSNERVEAEQHDRRSCSIWRRQATHSQVLGLSAQYTSRHRDVGAMSARTALPDDAGSL